LVDDSLKGAVPMADATVSAAPKPGIKHKVRATGLALAKQHLDSITPEGLAAIVRNCPPNDTIREALQEVVNYLLAKDPSAVPPTAAK
jgi:hypothetical protein